MHPTTGEDFLPAIASSHHGVGGCSTHDTRITFIPTAEQLMRYATAMNWSKKRMDNYYETAAQIMQLHWSGNDREPFYERVLKVLHDTGTLSRREMIDQYNVRNNSAGYVALAMYVCFCKREP